MEWYDDKPMVHAYCLCLFRLGGTPILFRLIYWSNGHGRERCNPKRPLCIGALLNDHYIGLKSRWLASGLVHMLLLRQPPPKGKGHMLRAQIDRADGPWSGQSIVVARTVRACVESVSVPNSSRDLLAKTTCSGSIPPLYIDEGLQLIEPHNRSNQVYF